VLLLSNTTSSPRPTRFPYTTLFRSHGEEGPADRELVGAHRCVRDENGQQPQNERPADDDEGDRRAENERHHTQEAAGESLGRSGSFPVEDLHERRHEQCGDQWSRQELECEVRQEVGRLEQIAEEGRPQNGRDHRDPDEPCHPAHQCPPGDCHRVARHAIGGRWCCASGGGAQGGVRHGSRRSCVAATIQSEARIPPTTTPSAVALTGVSPAGSSLKRASDRTCTRGRAMSSTSSSNWFPRRSSSSSIRRARSSSSLAISSSVGVTRDVIRASSSASCASSVARVSSICPDRNVAAPDGASALLRMSASRLSSSTSLLVASSISDSSRPLSASIEDNVDCCSARSASRPSIASSRSAILSSRYVAKAPLLARPASATKDDTTAAATDSAVDGSGSVTSNRMMRLSFWISVVSISRTSVSDRPNCSATGARTVGLLAITSKLRSSRSMREESVPVLPTNTWASAA